MAEARAEDKPLVFLIRAEAEDGAVPDKYEAEFAARGWRSVSIPVLAFRWVNLDALAEAVAAPAQYGGIVIASPRAVCALSRALAEHPIADSASVLAQWSANPVYVVGEATAADVRRLLGWPSRGEQCGGAEALAALIVADRRQGDTSADTRSHAPLLMPCGNNRRDALPDAMRSAGIPLVEMCCYESAPDPSFGGRFADACRAHGVPSAVGVFSPLGVPPTLDALRACGSFSGVRLAAIGKTTAAALVEHGGIEPAVAAKPSPSGLADAVCGPKG